MIKTKWQEAPVWLPMETIRGNAYCSGDVEKLNSYSLLRI